MSGIQFHEIKAGRQLLDRTLHEIARQLAALVKAVERLADAVEARRDERGRRGPDSRA